MNKSNTAVRRTLPLTLASLGVLDGLQPATIDILLCDRDETTFPPDDYFNAFYVNSDVDCRGKTYDRRQSWMEMGFLLNYIGFNFGRRINELSLDDRASFWVTISDSEIGGTDTATDARQFYDTVVGDWGEVLISRDFGLFSRSNIFLDELLAGFGNPGNTLGLVDGKGVSFGNIGTGCPYLFLTSQITYRRNDLLPGLRIAAGILDPIDSNQIDRDASGGLDDKAYQDNPHYENKVSYQFDLAGVQVYSWINGGYQTPKSTSDNVDNVTSKGVGYGLWVKIDGFSVTGSGFAAKGINPFFTSNAGEVALRGIDSRGASPQGPYSWNKNRLALSYDKAVDDNNSLGSAADYESRDTAYLRTINDNLKLTAEPNRCQIDERDGATLDEDTDTMALNAILNQ